MKRRQEGLARSGAGENPVVRSPLELWRLKGGVSHRAEGEERRAPDSILAIYGERATSTFIMEGEVASIHFDRGRGEIFFRGHNIRHLDLTPAQLAALGSFEEVLRGDPKGKRLAGDYGATLARCLADKKRGG